MLVDSVGEAEEGEWNCEMQSYPDEQGEYRSAQEYTHLVRKDIINSN